MGIKRVSRGGCDREGHLAQSQDLRDQGGMSLGTSPQKRGEWVGLEGGDSFPRVCVVCSCACACVSP